ncbi:glucan synthase 1-related protein [Minicystis rosea]|nr:glucan synthase 1-related protein [Minicystis rosea]
MAKKNVEKAGNAGKAETGAVPFDPARYAGAIAKIEALARKAGFTLPPGASEKAIAKAEAKLGVTFPHEVRAYYLAHDGGPDEVPMFNGRALLGLEGMLHQWGVWKEVMEEVGDENDDSVEPDPGVQQKWWIPEWIPVTMDFGGNNEMIDLAPAKRGKVGQVICVWHDDDSRTVDGEDFLSWLQEQTWGDGEAAAADDDDEDDEDEDDEDEDDESDDEESDDEGSDDEESGVAEAAYDATVPSPKALAPSKGKAGKYVFLFQLGKGAKVGDERVPAAFTTSPCYFYRDDQKALAKHLSAIDEPDVDEDEGELTFSAIEAFIEEHNLRRQLYTDAEAETDEEYSESHGFHAGATYEEAKAALARGGFRVVDLMDPPGVARDIADLARRLDMASLDLVIDGLAPDAESLGDQADGAGRIIAAAFARDGAAALTEAIKIAAPAWTDGERDRLLLIAGHTGRAYALEADDDAAALAGVRKLIAAIPPTNNAAVRKHLQAWELGGAGAPAEKAKPKKR